jgi:hypothetical protein
MKDEGWRGGIFLAIAVGMVLFIAACGPGRSATQTAIAQTEVQQTAEEATRKAPTNTPPATTPPSTDPHDSGCGGGLRSYHRNPG